jgi:hypothetical protein
VYRPISVHGLRATGLSEESSENAMNTPILIAISVHAFAAVKKFLNWPQAVYETLQILSLTLGEQISLNERFAPIDTNQEPTVTYTELVSSLIVGHYWPLPITPPNRLLDPTGC